MDIQVAFRLSATGTGPRKDIFTSVHYHLVGSLWHESCLSATLQLLGRKNVETTQRGSGCHSCQPGQPQCPEIKIVCTPRRKRDSSATSDSIGLCKSDAQIKGSREEKKKRKKNPGKMTQEVQILKLLICSGRNSVQISGICASDETNTRTDSYLTRKR